MLEPAEIYYEDFSVYVLFFCSSFLVSFFLLVSLLLFFFSFSGTTAKGTCPVVLSPRWTFSALGKVVVSRFHFILTRDHPPPGIYDTLTLKMTCTEAITFLQIVLKEILLHGL